MAHRCAGQLESELNSLEAQVVARGATQVKLAIVILLCTLLVGCTKVHAQEQQKPIEERYPPQCTKKITYNCAYYQATATVAVPFDVPPTTWSKMEQVAGPHRKCRPNESSSADYCWDTITANVKHSVCTIPSTHQPDPRRFPIQDATGVTHCLALTRESR